MLPFSTHIMTVQYNSSFHTSEICSFENFSRACLSRAFRVYVRRSYGCHHACMTMCLPKENTSIWSLWHQSISDISQKTAYNIWLALGAVAGHAYVQNVRELGHIFGFLAFSGERMTGITWILASLCILTNVRIDCLLVTVSWFPYLACNFDLKERVGFQTLSGERERMAWYFALWYILSTFKTD